jgi:hypothetical protein
MIFWSFCFFPETEVVPGRRPAFLQLRFRDPASVRRKFISVNSA